ncbi:MAG: glycosyltransferase [Bacteroidales bacterium]|nr:glycosyltransferase [Bacteroidales bacterium]
MARRLLQINPVVRINTSTGRIMQEIGELAMAHGWESYIAYSRGRDGLKPCQSRTVPVGNRVDVAWHGLMTRLLDRHGLASVGPTERLVAEMRRIQPDIVHIHNIHGYFLNYPVLFRYLAEADIPVIWTVHDCWLYTGHCYHYDYIGCDRWQLGCGQCPQQHKFPASWLVDRSHQNFEDKRRAFTSMPHHRLTIVPVSHWMRDEMSRSMLADYDYRVIHNGIDTDIFQPYEDTAEVRRLYHIGERQHVVLGVASVWSAEKGLDDLLHLATLLHEDETLVLVGVSDEVCKQLPAGVVGIRRTENIGQLARLYATADVFVNATWQDNYPTVNLESIACGTPVVTYRTGGSIESVTDATGLVVEQGDVQGLLDAVRSMEHKGKDAYRQVCRDYALAHFRKEDRYADYLKLYDELLAR